MEEDRTLCAFDRNNLFFAIVSSDGVINIWDVTSNKCNKLKQKAHLQMKFTCLKWNQSGNLLAAGTHTGSVICWDVKKGSEVFTWSKDDQAPIYDICFSNKDAIFVCGNFSEIIEIQKDQVVRTFKGDRKRTYKLVLSADESNLISAGHSYIKVWDLSSNNTITKFSAFSTTVNGLASTWNDQYLLLSSVDQRTINLCSLQTDDDDERIIQTFSCDQPPTSLTTFYQQTDKSKKRTKRKIDQEGNSQEISVSLSINLLAVQPKYVSVWEFSSSMKEERALTAQSRINVPDGADDSIRIFAAEFVNSTQVLLAFGTTLKPKFEKITFKNKSDFIKRIPLEVNASNLLGASQSTTTTTPKKSNKDVHLVSDADTHIPSKPKDKYASEVKISLEETLEQLEQKKKASRPSKQLKQEETQSSVPVADSIHVSLIQALQSGDHQLLASCLSVTDVDVIHKTIERVPNEYIVTFLNSLITKIQHSPSRSLKLLPWIQAIIIIHTPFLMTLPDLHGTGLSGLYQNIESRVSSFDKLLKLSGRMDLLMTQISFREHHYQKHATPALATSIDEIEDEEEEDEGNQSEEMEESSE